MQLARNFTHALSVYGPKSSLHGLYHFYQSKDRVRRLFWLIILLSAIGAGVFHTVMSARRFLNMDIFVHVSDEAVRATFPEVTLCNMKPFGETLLLYYSDVVEKHFLDKWNYFENWYVREREQRPSEGAIIYRERLKRIFARFLEIMWVSEDIRDFSMTSRVSILMCKYAGHSCDYKNFTLIRDPDGWNCYNIVLSNDESDKSEAGLSLILFTDNNIFHPIHDGSLVSRSNNVLSFSNTTDLSKLSSFKYVLQKKKRSLNQMAAPSMFQSDGFRVIIHEPHSHPMMSLHRLEFESGVVGSISIDQMLMKRIERPGIFDCKNKPYKQVRYVTDFESEDSLSYRSYNKLLDDHVVEAKQNLVHEACGCYSHRYPFQNSKRSLCYYAPRSERLNPSDALTKRMDCHDQAVQDADKETYQLMTKFRSTAPCDSILPTFYTNVYGWPKNEDIAEIVNTYILQRFINGTELLPSDGHKHEIFNFSDSNIVKMLGSRMISKQAAALKLLLHQNCSTDPAVRKLSLMDFWCLKSNELLRRNLLKLDIKNWRKKSRLAKEHFSYEWPEALSELGGVCGLWLGMSVLTLCELLEVAYIILTTRVERGPKDDKPRESTVHFRDTDAEIQMAVLNRERNYEQSSGHSRM